MAVADEFALGEWQCMAFDANEKSYQATAPTMQQAMALALRLCQNGSKKQRCRTAQSFCSQNPTQDRCVVSDETGRAWNTTGPDACKSALEMCNRWQFLNGNTTDNNLCTVTHP